MQLCSLLGIYFVCGAGLKIMFKDVFKHFFEPDKIFNAKQDDS